MPSAGLSFEFGPFVLEPKERRLFRDRGLIPIPPKAFDLLVFLVEHADRLLKKDELMEHVWPGVFVEEVNLAQSISAIRRALGGGRQTYIQTVAGAGYRFVAPVRRPPDSQGEAPARPGLDAPSIAILPFADMSPEKDQAYFCEGIAEELINALAALPGLRVASRTSALQFKERSADISLIGRQLNVDCVLEGSVRKAGSRLRITLHLIKVADGFPLWSERYDRDLGDVFAIQDEIARAIAAKLRITLPRTGGLPLAKRPTDNPEAYSFYLQGRFHWRQFTPGSPQQAIGCFERAIALDPEYALAYAGVAHVYSSLAIYYWIPQRVADQHARAAAERAVALGDDLAQTHASLGWVRLLFEQDAVAAERHFRLAIERHPNTVYGHYYLGVLDVGRGRFREGLARLQRLCDAHPDIVAFHVTLAYSCRLAGEVERAVDLCARALEIDDQSPVTMWHYGLALSAANRHGEAMRSCEQALDRSSRNLYALAALGRCCARAGHAEAARAVLDELGTRAATEHVPSMMLAWLHAALHERDAALDALERACDEHDVQIWWMKHDAVFAPLQGEPRYEGVVRRVYGGV